MSLKNFSQFVNSVLELGKYRISIPVALSALTGYALLGSIIDVDAFLVFSGVFFMSMGASALNQVQEHKTDALMERTKNRPIVSKKITVTQGLIIAFLLSLLGFILLFITKNSLAGFLGLFNLIWYNLIYTYLKKQSPFAVVPGALVGAIPPIIGYVAAGGYIFNPEILGYGFVFFMAQIPHFWLLLVKYGHQYEKAGLASLTKLFNSAQINRLSFIWILGTLIVSLSLPFFGSYTKPFTKIILLLIVIIFLTRFSIIFLKEKKQIDDKKPNYWRVKFMTLNLFVLGLIFLVWLDRLIS